MKIKIKYIFYSRLSAYFHPLRNKMKFNITFLLTEFNKNKPKYVKHKKRKKSNAPLFQIEV